jgi:S-adenosylmethionine-dependent methyltransferase
VTNDPSLDAVRAYYARFAGREWERLSNPNDGVIEFTLTCRALLRHLPKSGTILDLGGGPGRYAIWLAERGYRVVLADLSPGLLELARERIDKAGVGERVKAIVVADARDLSQWKDTSFDAVLALGPFYHLPVQADRVSAATELVRVLKAGAPGFVALMPRYALLRRTMVIPDERKHLLQDDWLERLMTDGAFENDNPGRFNYGYGVRPEEVAPFFEHYGLDTLELLGIESLSVGIEEQLARLADDAPDVYQRVIGLLDEAASDPGILGLCGHLLYIGRKSGEGV